MHACADAGAKKIKYLQTQDGFELSRSKMRRQKKKWRQKLDVQGASSQGTGLEDSDSEFLENGVGVGGRAVGGQNIRGVNEEGLHDFAPEGMSEKMRTRDLRQVAAMQRTARTWEPLAQPTWTRLRLPAQPPRWAKTWRVVRRSARSLLSRGKWAVTEALRTGRRLRPASI